MYVEYKVYVNNIVADFSKEELSVVITTEQAIGLLNDDLIWRIYNNAIQLQLTSNLTVVAEWPLSNGKMYYTTHPQRPSFDD